MTTLRTDRSWLGLLAAGSLAILAYYAVPPFLPLGGSIAHLILACSIGPMVIAAIVIGVRRHRPEGSRAWWCFLASQAFFWAGDILFFAYRDVLHEAVFPAPSDAFYLAQYPMVITALILLIRRRSPSRDRASVIDALILGTGASVVSWIVLIRPNALSSVGEFAAATSVAYPIADLVVLAVALRLFVGGATRTPAFLLLGGWICILLGTDALYAWMQLHGSFAVGGIIEGGWMVSYLLLGAAALHPSMTTLSQPVARRGELLGSRRLSLLACAAVVPGLLIANPWLNLGTATDEAVDLAAAVLMLLVIARLADSMFVQRRVIAEKLRVEAALSSRERELSAERAFLHATLNSMHDGIVAADAGGRVTLVNDAVRTLLGTSADTVDLAAIDFRREGGVARIPRAELPLVRALSGEQIRDQEMVLVARDESRRTVLVSARPTRINEQWGGAVMALQDVTERRRFEELARAKVELERTNQAKNEFLSRVSHELRTPLNAILGFGQLLSGSEALTVRDRENVEQVLTSGRHLLTLIEDVLQVSRSEDATSSLSGEPVEVGPIVHTVTDMLSPQAAERSIALEVDVADATLAQADERRLREILVNLVSNAIKYNHAGGRVVVSAAAVAGRLRVSVADTGVGIAPEGRERLFRPFERLDAERLGVEGTGLGLTIVKAQVEQMGGSVQVASTPGVGSTFTIDLPLPVEAMSPAPSWSAAPSALYIEDNEANIELVRRVFEMRPRVDLFTAMNGRVGLELARRHRPSLILLDLNLPDIAGDEILARLRAHPATAATPVVVVSADASSGRVATVLAAGASDYMTKPIDVSRLLGLVDKAVPA